MSKMTHILSGFIILLNNYHENINIIIIIEYLMAKGTDTPISEYQSL